MFPKELPQPEACDFNQYKPTDWDHVVYIEGLAVPERNFEGRKCGKWVALMSPQGVIVVNMIHKDYPHTVCQIQCTPDDTGTNYHAFIVHWPPIEGDHTGVHIPEELAEEMFFAVFPQVMSQLQEKGGRLA